LRLLGLGFTALLFAVACGGGSSHSTGGDIPGIQVEVTSPKGAAAADVGQVIPIAVTVTGDSSNAGVIWSVAATLKGNPAGTLSDVQSSTATYNPPEGINVPIQVAVTATSVTDPGRAATIPITVYPALTFSTIPPTPPLATAFFNTAYTCITVPISNGVTQVPCEVGVSGGLGPYTWTVDSPGLPAGLLLGRGQFSNTEAIVGKPTVIGMYPFTLTVTDVLGGTNKTSLNINVAPSQLKVVTPTILSTFVGKAYAPVQLHADGGVPPYFWSLAPGSGPLPPGMTLSRTGVIAGTPTDTSGASFAVRVQDSETPIPAEATFPSPLPVNGRVISLTVTNTEEPCDRGSNNVKADTPYAFSFSGFDADGPVTIAGSFTADSHGDITGGVEDVVRASGAQLDQPLTPGGFVGFANSGRGCLVLNTASSSSQFRATPTLQGTEHFVRAARFIEFDDTDGSGRRGTGTLQIQDSTIFPNPLSGSYAVRFAGQDQAGGHVAVAGRLVADTGVFTSVIADVNDNGAFAGPVGGSGAFSPADPNGRGTATLSVGSQNLDLTYYAVDARHVIFASRNVATPGHPAVTGEAILSAGPFSQSSLADSQIYRLSGASAGMPDLSVGVLHLAGNSLSGVALRRAGASSSNTSLSGAFAVDANSGRVTFTGTAIAAVGYLTSDTRGITAYLVGTGSSASDGVVEYQTDSYPPGYQFNPVVGRYGFAVDEMLDPQTVVFTGSISPSANIRGGLDDAYLDASSRTLGLLPQETFALFGMTFTPEGSGIFGGDTYMVTNGAKVFYIDISPFNTQPAVAVGQLQSVPAISTFKPACGPVGTQVVLTGVNLIETSAFGFNGTPATSFSANSNIQITATVPEGATTGPITITTPLGSNTSSNIFTVQASQCN
jgi:hypothetical protein